MKFLPGSKFYIEQWGPNSHMKFWSELEFHKSYDRDENFTGPSEEEGSSFHMNK